jgi:predicted nucleotidyltransferase
MEYLTKILTILKELKPILISKYYVDSIGIFGSAARNDFSPNSSDIDIIVDFDRPIGIEFIDLADYLETELKRKVDLVSRKGIKDKYFSEIKSEIIYV